VHHLVTSHKKSCELVRSVPIRGVVAAQSLEPARQIAGHKDTTAVQVLIIAQTGDESNRYLANQCEIPREFSIFTFANNRVHAHANG
jgi:hypothetical protein